MSTPLCSYSVPCSRTVYSFEEMYTSQVDQVAGGFYVTINFPEKIK